MPGIWAAGSNPGYGLERSQRLEGRASHRQFSLVQFQFQSFREISAIHLPPDIAPWFRGARSHFCLNFGASVAIPRVRTLETKLGAGVLIC